MLPSEIIVETVEVALYCPTLVVHFDNALLFTIPVFCEPISTRLHSHMSCMRLYIDALCMARM